MLLDGLLAVRAGFPLILRRFIAADVEIGGGEEGRNFINDIKNKLIGAFLARAGGTVPIFPVERFFRNGLSIEPVDLAGNLAGRILSSLVFLYPGFASTESSHQSSSHESLWH